MTTRGRRLDDGWRQAIRSVRSGLSRASRPLRRAPAFSLAVILTLTIGIGSSTAIFGVVNAILLRPLAYPNPDRLVAIVSDMPSLSMVHVGETVGIYLAYQRYAHTLERVALYQQGSANVTDVDGRSGPVRLNVAYATASLLSVLGVSPIRGRFYTDAEDAPKRPKVVVISERLWRTRFGSDPHITSRAIMLGSEQSDIVGVMPASSAFPELTSISGCLCKSIRIRRRAALPTTQSRGLRQLRRRRPLLASWLSSCHGPQRSRRRLPRTVWP